MKFIKFKKQIVALGIGASLVVGGATVYAGSVLPEAVVDNIAKILNPGASPLKAYDEESLNQLYETYGKEIEKYTEDELKRAFTEMEEFKKDRTTYIKEELKSYKDNLETETTNQINKEIAAYKNEMQSLADQEIEKYKEKLITDLEESIKNPNLQ